MPLGSRSNPFIPGYGRARRPRPDLKGSSRQRSRRKEVAGPFRSDSSIPSVRRGGREAPSRARPSRAAQRSLGLTPSRFTTSAGTSLPSLLSMTKEQREALERKGKRASGLREALEAHANAKSAPSTLEVLEIASLGIPGVGLVGGAAKAGRGAATLAERLTSGASRAVKASERAAARAGAKGRKLEDVRVKPRSKARRTASKAAKNPAVRAAGRVASTPLRRPKTTLAAGPIAAQAPTALLAGDPAEFKKGLEGTGNLAAILQGVGSVAATITPGKVAQNLVKDAFNLPAVVLPSVYLPAAGAVEAAQGDSSRLRKLLADYNEAGLLPAVFRGDVDAALEAIEAHPLYSGLEASGAASIVGRGAGAVARGTTGGRVGGTARPDLKIKGYEGRGNVRPIAGRLGSGGVRYSPDLIRQGLQRVADRRRVRKRDGHFASPAEAGRAIKASGDRFAYEHEVIRRMSRDETIKAVEGQRPGGKLGAEVRKAAGTRDNPSAGVVSLAVQRIIRKPETFAADLRTYRAQLVVTQRSGKLTPSERKANKELVKVVDRALEAGEPEQVYAAANAFIQHHADSVDTLVSRGLLDEAQARKAAAIPFARVHMDADYKPGTGVVGRDGKPLSLDRIEAEMKRHRIEPPGFLTHRPNSRGGGSFYRSFFPDRQRIPNQRRTGEATTRGSYDASYGALVEQAARSRSIADAATGFDRFVKEFRKEPPRGVKTFDDARRVLNDPEHFGLTLPEGVEFVPFRTQPFTALRRETQAALEHQGRLDPTQEAVLERLPARALDEALRPGPGPLVFMPRLLTDRMRQHHAQLLPGEKAGQAVTGAFTGVVLPTSPGWLYGNTLDIGMRSMMSGLGFGDYFLGRRLAKRLPKGAKASIISGSHLSSFKRIQVHREAQQFAETSLGPLARAVGTFRRTPGPRQLVDAYAKYRDAVFYFNTRFIEKQPQYAALGKEARRELQATTGQWHHALMVGEGALGDLARGLRNTDKQLAYAKALEEVFGNWGKNSPGARRFMRTLAPFWMWARAATRFVALTMPAHHPIKTGLIAAAAEMTETERKQLGLDKFGPLPLPGFLQGGLPIRGGISPWSKYTSFGFFADYPANLAGMVLPQAAGAIKAATGFDWKGDQLVDSEGRALREPALVLAAALTQAEAFTPFLTLVRNFAKGGASKAASPLRTFDADAVDYLRGLSESRQIDVPAKGSSTSGSSDSTLSPATESYMGELGGGSRGSSGLNSATEDYMKALGR